jgi:hypothetical protein
MKEQPEGLLLPGYFGSLCINFLIEQVLQIFLNLIRHEMGSCSFLNGCDDNLRLLHLGSCKNNFNQFFLA